MSKSQIAVVFELHRIELADERTSYPLPTSRTTIGLYSNLELAESEMRRSNLETDSVTDDDTDRGRTNCKLSRVHHFTINARTLDVPQPIGECKRLVYDEQGVFYGLCPPENEPFKGIKPEDCKFKVGEIVEAIQNGSLRIGIISLLPVEPEKACRLFCIDQTDNTYCVEFGGRHRSHDHLPECDLFRPALPVSAATRKRLLRTYRHLKTEC